FARKLPSTLGWATASCTPGTVRVCQASGISTVIRGGPGNSALGYEMLWTMKWLRSSHQRRRSTYQSSTRPDRGIQPGRRPFAGAVGHHDQVVEAVSCSAALRSAESPRSLTALMI